MLRCLLSVLLACGAWACGDNLPLSAVSKHCDADAPPAAYKTVTVWNADPESLPWPTIMRGADAWNRKCLRFEQGASENAAMLKVYPVQNVCPIDETNGTFILAKTNIKAGKVTVYMECFQYLPDGYGMQPSLVISTTHEFGHGAGMPGHIHEMHDLRLAVNPFETELMDAGIWGKAVMNPNLNSSLALTQLDERAYDLRIPSISPERFAAIAEDAPGPGDVWDVAPGPDRCLFTLR